MSGGMSNVYKLGFVVSDIYDAMDRYSEIYKISKWYRVLREPEDERFMEGQIYDGVEIVLGFSKKTEIELMTVTGAQGLFSSFLRENGPGLHRLCFLVSDLDGAVLEYKQVGYEVLKEGRYYPGRGLTARYSLMARPGEPGGRVMELTEMRFGRFNVMRPVRNMLLRIMSGGLELVDETAGPGAPKS